MASTEVDRTSPTDLGDGNLEKLTAPQLRQLVTLSQQFNATINLHELLPHILRLVVETLDAEGGSIWTLAGDTLRCEVWDGPGADRMVGAELPNGIGFVGDAARRGKPVRVVEAASDDRHLPQLDEATGFQTRSVLAVPLLARGEIIGAMEVANDRHTEDGVFEEHQLAFLLAVADDAAAAISNARLFEAEKQARDLRALLDFTHEITSTFDIERIQLSIVNLAGDAIRFDRCVLATWEDETLRVRAISGEQTVDRKSSAVQDAEQLMLWCLERGEEFAVPSLTDGDDENATELTKKFRRYLEESGAQGLLVESIHDGEGRLGALLFEFRRSGALTSWGQKAAQLLTKEAALALRNAELYAGVPFISWLEPLARRRRQLATLPRSSWLKSGAIALVVLGALTLVRLPLRIGAARATVRSAVQLPIRAGVAGIVEQMLVAEGDAVQAGTPIARLRDEADLLQQQETAGALQLAQRQVLAADASGDARGAALARVRVAAASDALTVLRQQEQRTLVRAPTDGIILTPHLEEKVGSYLDAGAVIAWVGEPDWVEVELQVSQSDVGDVAINDRVRVRVSAYPAITFQGRVRSIAPQADVDGGSPVYTVRAVLDNRLHMLRPGEEVRAKVWTRSRPIGYLLIRRPWRWLELNSWWLWPL